MSLYILIENQKLIWETMNKIPQFQEFGKTDQGEQQKWFQHIIQQFYESNKFKLLSVQDLQQLNRETLGYMIRELKTMKLKSLAPVFSNLSSPQYDLFNEPTVFTDQQHLLSAAEKKSVTRDYLMEKKQEELNRQFSARQNEYSSMLKKGPGLEIDFRLPMDTDEPIENIEELIKSQVNQRNIEFSPMKSQSETEPVQYNISETMRDEVLNSYSNEERFVKDPIETPKSVTIRRSEQFPFQDISDRPPKKNVQWANDLEVNTKIHHPPDYSIKERDRRNEEFKLIKEFMIEMKDIVQGLRVEMEDVKKTITGSGTKKQDLVQTQSVPNSNYLLTEYYGNYEESKPNLVITSDSDGLELNCEEL